MNKLVPFAAAAILAVMLCGCSNSAQPSQQQTSEPQAATQSNEKLTEEEKSQIVEYMQSDEFSALNASIENFASRFQEAVEAKDVDTIDEIFLNLSSAASNIENLDVPPVCSGIDFNIKQAARCYIVSAGDISSYLHGDAGEETLDEASEYASQGNQYLNDMTEEMNRLADLAK